MKPDVKYWKYKSLAEIQALDDETLMKVFEELKQAIKIFNDAHTPVTDEMFWQLMVIPNEVSKRLENEKKDR